MSFVTPSTSCAISSPKSLADLIEAGARVLDRVVQERRAQCLGVQPQAGADLRHLERVGDEVLARLALLVGVALAGEGEGALDRLAVDRLASVVAVLRDHREEVAEQRALLGASSSRVIESRARACSAVPSTARRPGCGRGDRVSRTAPSPASASPLPVSLTSVLLLAGIGWPPGVWRRQAPKARDRSRSVLSEDTTRRAGAAGAAPFAQPELPEHPHAAGGRLGRAGVFGARPTAAARSRIPRPRPRVGERAPDRGDRGPQIPLSAEHALGQLAAPPAPGEMEVSVRARRPPRPGPRRASIGAGRSTTTWRKRGAHPAQSASAAQSASTSARPPSSAAAQGGVERFGAAAEQAIAAGPPRSAAGPPRRRRARPPGGVGAEREHRLAARDQLGERGDRGAAPAIHHARAGAPRRRTSSSAPGRPAATRSSSASSRCHHSPSAAGQPSPHGDPRVHRPPPRAGRARAPPPAAAPLRSSGRPRARPRRRAAWPSRPRDLAVHAEGDARAPAGAAFELKARVLAAPLPSAAPREGAPRGPAAGPRGCPCRMARGARAARRHPCRCPRGPRPPGRRARSVRTRSSGSIRRGGVRDERLAKVVEAAGLDLQTRRRRDGRRTG